MTQPTNAPAAPGYGNEQAKSVTQQQLIDQANALAGATGSPSTDLYGLGNWRDQQIDPSGFPPAIALLLQQAGVNTSQPVTAAQLAKAIVQAKNPALVAQIQQMLFYAGAYGASTNFTDLQVGQFGDKDVKALAAEITNAGRAAQSFGTYLTSAANYGKANGILNRVTQAAQPVETYSSIDEDAALRAKANQLFGHDPSADEYARFRAFYNTEVEAAAKAKAAAQNPNLNLPDAGTLGQAIGDQAGGQFSNPPSAPAQTVLSGGRHFEGEPGQRGRMVPAATTNPAYADYQNRLGADQQAMGSVNQAANGLQAGGAGVFEQAPDLGNAAEAFLRQNNAADITQNNVVSKYADILKALVGNGVSG